MFVTYIRKENIVPKNSSRFIIPTSLIILPIAYYYFPIFAEHSLIELITVGTAYLFVAAYGISTLIWQKQINTNNLKLIQNKTYEISDELNSLTKSFKFKLIETKQIAEGNDKKKDPTNTYFEIVTNEKLQGSYAYFKEQGLNQKDFNSPTVEEKKPTTGPQTSHKPITWAKGLLNSQQLFLKEIRRAGFVCYSYCQETEVIQQMQKANKLHLWPQFKNIIDNPKFCGKIGKTKTGIKSITPFPGVVEINGKPVEIQYKWEMKIKGKGGTIARIYGYELPADLQKTGEPGPPVIIFSLFSPKGLHKLKDVKSMQEGEGRIAPPLAVPKQNEVIANLEPNQKITDENKNEERRKEKEEATEIENQINSTDSSSFIR